MPVPVDTDDIVQATTKWLSGKADVLAELGRFTATGEPYLFQNTLFLRMEYTESTACVIMRGGGWAAPNPHNTMRFPRIVIEITADPLRDDGHNIADPGEVIRRLEHAHKVIDRYLHRPGEGVQYWGSIRTLGSFRLAEPAVYPVPDGNGLQRLSCTYAVTEG